MVIRNSVPACSSLFMMDWLIGFVHLFGLMARETEIPDLSPKPPDTELRQANLFERAETLI